MYSFSIYFLTTGNGGGAGSCFLGACMFEEDDITEDLYVYYFEPVVSGTKEKKISQVFSQILSLVSVCHFVLFRVSY